MRMKTEAEQDEINEAIALIRSARRLLENAWGNADKRSSAERAILANLDTALQKLDPVRAKTETEQDAVPGDTFEAGA